MIQKTALITGASGGLGLEFAKILARKGNNLILVSRNLEKLQKIREDLENDSKKAIDLKNLPDRFIYIFQADLSRSEDIQRLWEDCQKREICVDLLINNAGSGLFGECVDLDPKLVESMLFLNIQALTTLCGLFGKQMKARRSGEILNVGSMAAHQPTPFFASYDASKSYVLHYSLALREELRRYGVNVTCIEPGYIRTNFDQAAKITDTSYLKFAYKNGLPASKVAQIGLKILQRKVGYRIIGISNKFAVLFFKLMPKSFIPRFMYWSLNRIFN